MSALFLLNFFSPIKEYSSFSTFLFWVRVGASLLLLEGVATSWDTIPDVNGVEVLTGLVGTLGGGAIVATLASAGTDSPEEDAGGAAGTGGTDSPEEGAGGGPTAVRGCIKFATGGSGDDGRDCTECGGGRDCTVCGGGRGCTRCGGGGRGCTGCGGGGGGTPDQSAGNVDPVGSCW